MNLFGFLCDFFGLAWLLSTVDAVLLPKVISCATFGPGNFLPPLQSEANGIQCEKYIFLGSLLQKGREILDSNQHQMKYGTQTGYVYFAQFMESWWIDHYMSIAALAYLCKGIQYVIFEVSIVNFALGYNVSLFWLFCVHVKLFCINLWLKAGVGTGWHWCNQSKRWKLKERKESWAKTFLRNNNPIPTA